MKSPATLAVVAFLLTAGVAPAVVAGPTTVAGDESVTSTPATDVDMEQARSIMEQARSMTDRASASSNLSPSLSWSNSPSLTRSTPQTRAENNTTNRLGLPEPSRANYSTVDLDFAATMQIDSLSVEKSYHVSLVSHLVDQSSSRAEANALVNSYLDEIVDRLDRLQDSEVRSIQRYNTRQISAETLLVQLALVDQTARAMEESLREVQIETDQLSQQTNDRFRGLDVEIKSLQNPILRHVALAARGEIDGEPNPLRVTAGQRGVILEMLAGGTYHRTAVRSDNRNLDGQDQLGGINEFQNRVSDWYPWGYENRQTEDIDTLTDRNLYTMTFQHPHGQLVTYMDGSTRDVYREEQTLILDRLPRTEQSTTRVNNVSVTLVRTAADGPFEVNVTHAETGDPLDAVVTVNDARVGRTGEGGSLWVLSPAPTYTVTVVTNGATINVSVGA